MARTNYQFGKRQRELAKKQKREEKITKRKERKEGGGLEAMEAAGGSTEPGLEESDGDAPADAAGGDASPAPSA